MLDSVSVDGRQERGFTQNQLPKRGQSTRTGPTASREGRNIELSDEVMLDINEVRGDACPTRWLLCEYRDGSPKKPLDRVCKGEGDVNELIEKLDVGRAMYGLYRVTDTVDDITTVKFVFIQW